MEVLEFVLLNFDVKDLVCVVLMCMYFNASGIVERVAGARMEFVLCVMVLMFMKWDLYLKVWYYCMFSECVECVVGNVLLG